MFYFIFYSKVVSPVEALIVAHHRCFTMDDNKTLCFTQSTTGGEMHHI